MTTVNNKFDRSHILCQTQSMRKPVQSRTLKTRARLLDAAEALVADQGFTALRVEEVVLKAGVAKGTFFAHFRDKDALMELLIGARMDAFLDAWGDKTPPKTAAQMVAIMSDLLTFMRCERYVFDVILRYSGATIVEDIGPIAMAIGRFDALVQDWMTADTFRKDVDPRLLAEGVQAFVFQALALHFCALHADLPMNDRLENYLSAWLAAKA